MPETSRIDLSPLPIGAPDVALSTAQERRQTIGLHRNCVAPRVALLTKARELLDRDEATHAAALIDQVRNEYPLIAALCFYCEGGELRLVDLDNARRTRARGHGLALGHINLLVWDRAAIDGPGDLAEAKAIIKEHPEALTLTYESGRLWERRAAWERGWR